MGTSQSRMNKVGAAGIVVLGAFGAVKYGPTLLEKAHQRTMNELSCDASSTFVNDAKEESHQIHPVSSTTATRTNNSSTTSNNRTGTDTSSGRASIKPGSMEVAMRLQDVEVISVSNGSKRVLGSFWTTGDAFDDYDDEDCGGGWEHDNRQTNINPKAPATTLAPILTAPSHFASLSPSKNNSSTLGPNDKEDTNVTCPGPIVICLFRRFGCGVCRMNAENLSKALEPVLRKTNGQLIGIGLEDIGAADFVESGVFRNGTVYVDPRMSSFQKLKCHSVPWTRLWGITEPEVWRQSILSAKLGYKNNFQGNLSQWGGVFVLQGTGATANSSNSSSRCPTPPLVFGKFEEEQPTSSQQQTNTTGGAVLFSRGEEAMKYKQPGSLIYGQYQTGETFAPDVAAIVAAIEKC